MILSKIMTLRHLGLFSPEAPPNGPSLHYFHVGNPITDPMSIRGSMCVWLDETFLLRNLTAVKYCSVPDTGGIQSGFLNVFSDKAEELLSSCKLTGAAFVECLQKLSSLNYYLESHRPLPKLGLSVLSQYYSQLVMEFLANQTDPHAWIYEVCFDHDLIIADKDIKRLLVPNTYKDDPRIAVILKRLGSKTEYYNPKYGLESGIEFN